MQRQIKHQNKPSNKIEIFITTTREYNICSCLLMYYCDAVQESRGRHVVVDRFHSELYFPDYCDLKIFKLKLTGNSFII